jgi:hypothetical protein
LRKLAPKLAVRWDEDSRNAASFIADQSANAAGGGTCSVCSRVVSGSRIDRLREGRCEACAKYRQRNPGKERPRNLWGTDSVDDQCPNVQTHHGLDARCGLPWGHEAGCQFGSEAA